MTIDEGKSNHWIGCKQCDLWVNIFDIEEGCFSCNCDTTYISETKHEQENEICSEYDIAPYTLVSVYVPEDINVELGGIVYWDLNTGKYRNDHSGNVKILGSWVSQRDSDGNVELKLENMTMFHTLEEDNKNIKKLINKEGLGPEDLDMDGYGLHPSELQ